MAPTKCMHGVVRRKCGECGGARICEHERTKDTCPECGDGFTCEHGKVRRQCRDCRGSAFCEHNRRRTRCMLCGGGSLCLHGKRKERCKECGGSAFCVHEKRKDKCPDCAGVVNLCEHGKAETRCGRCKPKAAQRPMDTTCRSCQGTGRCSHCDGVGHCEALVQTKKCLICRAHVRHNSWIHVDALQLLPLGTLPALGTQPVDIPGEDSSQEAMVKVTGVESYTPLMNKAVRGNKLLLWENSGMS